MNDELLQKIIANRREGEAIDFSIALLEGLAPDEREAFVRQMLNVTASSDLDPETRELIVQKFLGLVESEDKAEYLRREFGDQDVEWPTKHA